MRKKMMLVKETNARFTSFNFFAVLCLEESIVNIVFFFSFINKYTTFCLEKIKVIKRFIKGFYILGVFFGNSRFEKKNCKMF